MTKNIWRLSVMSACFGCVALDNAKLVSALPTLARRSGADAALLRWVLEASLLFYASLLLLGGSLSERFGPRRMLLIGLTVFGGASVAGALGASSMLGLILSRALLGAGAACMTPATLATLKHTFPERERPRAIAVWTASFGIGAAAGPVLAGALLRVGGMPTILLANVPFVVLCGFGSYRLVPANLPRHRLPLDWFGLLLCLLAAGCLLFSLLTGPSEGWRLPSVTVALLGAIVFTCAAVAWVRRARNPILDPMLFVRTGFVRALLVILLGYFAFSGVSFVIAQYLQVARGQAALTAGLHNVPLPASLLVGTLLAPRLMLRFRAERALVYSLGLAVVGAVLLALASAAKRELLLCLALVPFGGGCGSAFATATELTLGSVTHERAASAAAISESAFELGGALGVAVLSTLLASSPTPDTLAASATRALWVGGGALACAFLAARQYGAPLAK